MMERYGSQSFCIELLKEYQCNSKYELDSETAKVAIQRRADKIPAQQCFLADTLN